MCKICSSNVEERPTPAAKNTFSRNSGDEKTAMNPAFIIIVIIIALLIWITLSYAFSDIGKIVKDLHKQVKKDIDKNEEDYQEEEK